MRITVDSVMALYPCNDWPRERVAEWFAGRKYAQATTALRDPAISLYDRLWLAIGLMDERQKRLFACDCAERALQRERTTGFEPDERSWHAIAVARRYATGEATDEELAAARAAAWAAAWAAARAAETDWQIEHAIEVL